jgi:Bax protein
MTNRYRPRSNFYKSLNQCLIVWSVVIASFMSVDTQADSLGTTPSLHSVSISQSPMAINLSTWPSFDSTGSATQSGPDYLPLTRTNIPVLSFLNEFRASLNASPEISYARELSKRPTVPALEAFWREQDRTLEAIFAGAAVPRLFLAHLPRDLPEIPDVKRRKETFITLMLPHVLAVNEEIFRDRNRILKLRSKLAKETPLTDAELKWLSKIFASYEVTTMNFDRLLARVDIIPPSLSIAQAAKESGWGSSRFAQKGNAIFGQWTWNLRDKGIVPKERPEGESYRVRAFDSVLAATRSYAKNLNTSAAYKDFRKSRSALREAKKPISGLALVEALENYSTKRHNYVLAVKEIIKLNRLKLLNNVELSQTSSAASDKGIQIFAQN